MSIIQGNAKQGSTRGFYNFPLEQSLRFNDNDSAYLEWTPDSAGNRKTWTWSGWVKRGNIGSTQYLFNVGVDGDNSHWLAFNSSDQFEFRFFTANVNRQRHVTEQVFRDPSAWYHIVCVLDTANATESDRAILYVNGERVTDFDTYEQYPTQDFEGLVNDDRVHNLGRDDRTNSSYFDGYLAEVNFLNGIAATADDFGELKNGVWIPKEYTGAYDSAAQVTAGNLNGFRLSFADDAEVEAFNTVLYRGDGSGNQSITGVGFQPDLLWIKRRDAAGGWNCVDAIRGTNKRLELHSTGGDFDQTVLQSFDSDGFTTGVTGVGESGGSYVAFGWEAGDSNVSNTDGSITSTVRANTTYGFSIVSYTGTGTNPTTIGHGLSSAPKMMIVKNRDQTDNWAVYHESIGASNHLELNTTNASISAAQVWAATAPTTSVFSTGTNHKTNASGEDYIAYCWAEKAGYSKFGSYTGTGSAGNEITTGFKPAVVIVKRTDTTSNWAIVDSTRSTNASEIDEFLKPNTSDAEVSTTDGFLFTDTGFEPQDTGSGTNATGGTFIYAAFADTREAAFWLDQSGNDNDWQPVNLDHNDTVADSPTDNYATLNLFTQNASRFTLSDGNLKNSIGTSGTYDALPEINTGKWYFEATYTTIASGNSFGVVDNLGFVVSYQSDGNSAKNKGSATAYGDTFTANDIIGLAFDADAGTAEFYKNGVSQGQITGITSYDSMRFGGFGGSGTVAVFNFGQQPFTYTPPTGYLALSTANLPEPTISPADDASPEDYFNTVLYTGNNNNGQAVTGVGFQPDFVWIKQRTTAVGHNLEDAVRGAGKFLQSESSAAEDITGNLVSFDSDGFTVGTGNRVDQGTNAYVAWNWKAGTSVSGSTGGSGTSKSYTGSVSTASGFSIIAYEGNGTAGHTIPHHLDSAPEMIIVKNRDAGEGWSVYTESTGNTGFLNLNGTGAFATSSGEWNNTSPTSSVFTVGTQGRVNSNTQDHIAYCFHSVEGFSKVGSSYTGNGSTDGPFVYTGFRPAFVMVKRTDASNNWVMLDSERDTYNVANASLLADRELAETDYGIDFDFLSNGFKLRSGNTPENATGGTYIYMAFAENPFKYSNAR